ncbi:hypothetical protein [Mycobacterium parmense]|uniref:Uncharacterized protein n=1 Tax=Mycobacterium parmense TaxID=185642 RepID=A0A7I7YSA3_9MYCO|nr:hypothetical protein [Mycobacterium parmense]MCV7351792.1 hypothetical protein [Mycobacterium parmense]BBZ44738.1 hypothetical protein MPRM_20190 [Mycobacterium parmense]
MTAETKPLWYTSNPDLGDERAELEAILKRYQVLFRKLLVPGAVDALDNINKLLNGFGNAQLNALGSLFFSLERTLFNSPSPIFNGEESYQRYLVEYVPLKHIRDFIYYIVTNMSDAVPAPFPGRESVIAFFVEWSSALSSFLLREGRGTMRYDPRTDGINFSNTPSETVALRQWSAQLDESLATFRGILNEEDARESAVQSAIEARHAADAARRAAGESGALSMGEHFQRIAADEQKSEKDWNKILFLLIAAILAMSAFIVYKSVYSQWVQTLLHLVIILPVIGAATYASRNAGHHRVVARWAKTASVQVNSVQAFAEQLSSPENRDRLILELGKNVFSTPAYGDPSKVEHFSAIPPDLLDAAKEVANKSLPEKAKRG